MKWFPLTMVDFVVMFLTLLVLDRADGGSHALSTSDWSWLPHVNGGLNLLICFFLVRGYLAIRRDDRVTHPRMMLTACGIGVLFVVGYVMQSLILGHQRFPGDDWVRTLFVWILATHTVLAVIVVPMIITVVVFGLRGSFERHRRLARVTLCIWAYVAVTGVYIYLMNNHVRPPLSGY